MAFLLVFVLFIGCNALQNSYFAAQHVYPAGKMVDQTNSRQIMVYGEAAQGKLGSSHVLVSGARY